MPPIAGAPKWIEPDALFAINDRFFALEADMGTESIEAVIKPKIRAYREIVASGVIDDHFGIDNLRVLFVTTNEKRMRNIMKRPSVDCAGTGVAPCSASLAGPTSASSRARRPRTGGCFREPWRRVGHEDCGLDLAKRSSRPIHRAGMGITPDRRAPLSYNLLRQTERSLPCPIRLTSSN